MRAFLTYSYLVESCPHLEESSFYLDKSIPGRVLPLTWKRVIQEESDP
jgi:hypothetical protein